MESWPATLPGSHGESFSPTRPGKYDRSGAAGVELGEEPKLDIIIIFNPKTIIKYLKNIILGKNY